MDFLFVHGKKESVKADRIIFRCFHLPMTLGALGIAGAAISLFAGHAGGGTQKFIMLILVISICLFAPNFMGFLQTSAGGLTISGL